MDATLPPSIPARRAVLAGALALAACRRRDTLTVSLTPPLDFDLLNRETARFAERARPGRLGVGLMNLESAQTFTFNGDQPFPLQSVFKLHLAAAVLAEVEAGRMTLDEPFLLTAQQLSPPWSPIAAAFPARRDYTAGELLAAAVRESDNTAADVLMKRIGGPGALTAWLRSKRLEETRIDRYERELQTEARGMASFRPAWAGTAAFLAARDAVPEPVRREALARYLRDPRDTATPRSILAFLKRLDAGELLGPVQTRRLLELLFSVPGGGDRVLAGLPRKTRFAHKTGTGGVELGINLACNDVGLAVLPDDRGYAICVLLAGSTLDGEAADAFSADLARMLTRALG